MGDRRHRLYGLRLLAAGLLVLLGQAALAAPDPATGRWRATEGPDVASGLELRADGRFSYGLSAGALDEGAEGRWVRDSASVRLYTEPRPKPPRLLVESMTPAEGAPLSIFVTAPNGQGIPGVRFRIEFDTGDPVESYTQYDGWTADPSDRRIARWVQLNEPIHDILSERVAVPQGARLLRFRLEPNDLGVVDFEGAEVLVEGDQLTLRDKRGDLHYVRARK